MKNIFAFFLLAALAFGQTSAVYKNSSTDEVTGNLVFGSGKSLSASGTGTITATSAPASGITGQLAVANGGTGVSTLTGYAKGSGATAFSGVSTIPILDGGTGATTASAARTNLDVYSKADTAAFTYNLTNPLATTRTVAQSIVYGGVAGDAVAGDVAPRTSPFAVRYRFYLNSLTANRGFSHPTTGLGLRAYINSSTGKFWMTSGGGDVLSSTATFTVGMWYDVIYVRESTTTNGTKIYINGVLDTTGTDATDYASAIDKVGAFLSDTSPMVGALSVYKANRALTAAEVAAIHAGNVPPDLFPAVAAGTSVNAGSFIVGAKYRISSAGTTDFTAVGAANSTVGTEFTATGVGTGTGVATTLGATLWSDPSQPGTGNIVRSVANVPGYIIKSASNSWLVPTSQLEKADILTRTQSSARGQMLQLSGAQGRSTATLGFDVGTAPFGVFARFYCPLTAPASLQGVFLLSSAGGLGPGALYGALSSNGSLTISVFSTAGISASATVSNFVSAYAGKFVALSIERDAVGTLVLKCNKETLTYVTTTVGSGTLSLPILSTKYDASTLGADGYPYLGTIVPPTLLLGNLTAAESATWNATGEFPAWTRVAGGAGVNVGVGALANGATGYEYDVFTGASSTGFTAVKTTTTHPAYANIYGPTVYKPGQKVRIIFDATLTSGTPPMLNVENATLDKTATITAGRNEFVATFAAQSTFALHFINAIGDSSSYAIANYDAKSLGLAFHPDERWDGRGGVWPDVSGAFGRGLVLATSGVTPAVLGNGTNRILATTATNGNQQLYGASIISGVAQIIRVRAKASTGTPTVTLGNASGGAQIVASTALSTSWKNLAIVSGGEITTTANLWASSNSTDTIYWDIEVQSFNN